MQIPVLCALCLKSHTLRDLRKLIKYEERKKEVESKLDDIDKQPHARRIQVGIWFSSLGIYLCLRCRTHPLLQNWKQSRVEESEGERKGEMRRRR